MAAQNIPLTGPAYTPKGPEWERASESTKRTYWRRLGEAGIGIYREERRKGVGVDGDKLLPVKPKSRPDGAKGPPLIPHYGDSRTNRLLAMKATVRGATLFWHAGMTKRCRVPWATILGYHADGVVIGAPVRDVIGFTDSGEKKVTDRGKTLWKTMVRTGEAGKGVKPTPAEKPAAKPPKREAAPPRVTREPIEPVKPWTKSGPEPAPSREEAIRRAPKGKRPRYLEYEEETSGPPTIGEAIRASGVLPPTPPPTTPDAPPVPMPTLKLPRVKREPPPPRVRREPIEPPPPVVVAPARAAPAPGEAIPPKPPGEPAALGLAFRPTEGAKVQKQPTVKVDVAAVDVAWSLDVGYYIPPGGQPTLEGQAKYAIVKAFIEKALRAGIVIDQSRITVDADGTVSFTDGRHRFAVLRDMGATILPVSVDRSHAQRARDLFRPETT